MDPKNSPKGFLPKYGTHQREAFNSGKNARRDGKPRVHPFGMKGDCANPRSAILVSWWLRGYDDQDIRGKT